MVLLRVSKGMKREGRAKRPYPTARKKVCNRRVSTFFLPPPLLLLDSSVAVAGDQGRVSRDWHLLKVLLSRRVLTSPKIFVERDMPYRGSKEKDPPQVSRCLLLLVSDTQCHIDTPTTTIKDTGKEDHMKCNHKDHPRDHTSPSLYNFIPLLILMKAGLASPLLAEGGTICLMLVLVLVLVLLLLIMKASCLYIPSGCVC